MSTQPAGFLGRFIVELITDDADGLWEHYQPFGFRSKTGKEYWAPIGHRTDFCSVPRVPGVYDILGNRARRAGSIHDYLYSGVVSREEADELLREMLVLDGISECEAEQFFLAVRLFGASHYAPEPAANDAAAQAA